MKTIYYYKQKEQMGDLLRSNGVFIKEDFSDDEREELKKKLEEYMSAHKEPEITINLKKFYLVIKGADEASYLYQCIQ